MAGSRPIISQIYFTMVPFLVNVLEFFSNKMLIIRAGIHKMLVRIGQLLQKQSEFGLHCNVYAFYNRRLVFETLEHLLYST